VIVYLAHLRASIKPTAHSPASEDTHVGVALELDDDAGASRQLAGAVTENWIELVAFTETRLGRNRRC
jgi:hypothetical protein